MPIASNPLVYVVDDDTLIRSTLESILKVRNYRVSTFGSGIQFLQAKFEDDASCILLDMTMPGLSGLDVLKTLKERGCAIPVIFLTAHTDIVLSVLAMKAGAEDFLSKPIQTEQLLSSIEKAHEHCLGNLQSRALLDDLRCSYAALSDTELQVFNRVIRGRLNKQIAYELGYAERTIKAYRSSIMEKMKVNNLANLVLCSIQLGLLE
ncbi:response regulator transcription factor [Undibacterium sp. SXout20W]|uniref:response regulator transcription factor n=1 Tax=Undibacterium sp. SXout20W TaxID=3413051 RepID=UPI003BF01ACF